MGFGKVAPAPFSLVCPSAQPASAATQRMILRERITIDPPDSDYCDWKDRPFSPRRITERLQPNKIRVKTCYCGNECDRKTELPTWPLAHAVEAMALRKVQ